MANFTRNGYGQVEANQLSAQKTGQIFASLPLASEVSVLQNGEFMYYDYANNCVTAGVAAGDLLTPVKNATSKTLVLEKNDPTANAGAGNAICALRFVVAKVYTMPDGQPGLKLQRVE